MVVDFLVDIVVVVGFSVDVVMVVGCWVVDVVTGAVVEDFRVTIVVCIVVVKSVESVTK